MVEFLTSWAFGGIAILVVLLIFRSAENASRKRHDSHMQCFETLNGDAALRLMDERENRRLEKFHAFVQSLDAPEAREKDGSRIPGWSKAER